MQIFLEKSSIVQQLLDHFRFFFLKNKNLSYKILFHFHFQTWLFPKTKPYTWKKLEILPISYSWFNQRFSITALVHSK